MIRPLQKTAIATLAAVVLVSLAAETSMSADPCDAAFGGFSGPPRPPYGWCEPGPYQECGPKWTLADWVCSVFQVHRLPEEEVLAIHSEHHRVSRLNYYLHEQAHKAFLHPVSPPLYSPTFGYHQTCWRPFPRYDLAPRVPWEAYGTYGAPMGSPPGSEGTPPAPDYTPTPDAIPYSPPREAPPVPEAPDALPEAPDALPETPPEPEAFLDVPAHQPRY